MFAQAADTIHRAAADLWPHQPVHLVEQVPSPTSYVQRLRVGDRPLYAKVSLLGVSLVSLLRGACGTWPAVQAAQSVYQDSGDGLLEREAAQLHALAAARYPRVCTPAGVARGVLFTEPVAGSSLGELLLLQPGDAAVLLQVPLDELRALRHPSVVHRLRPFAPISERSITGTFLRKFTGVTGSVYLNRLGIDRCAPAQRDDVVDLLRATVARLQRLGTELTPGRPALVYGDLKPEHVLFPDGPGQRPVLLDPGLLRARPATDYAKLASRTVLLLAARRPSSAIAGSIAQGLADVAERHTERSTRRTWLREVLTLWLMDTINILTTYLSAPSTLPLPAQAMALIGRAETVCALVDAISGDLAVNADPAAVWDRALERIEVAGS
ncbi:hypothetical protein [Streptomyces sp. HPF1205]|uniref:hypothetical protein n=1 Tax=Streptomyces sp. HPF1205 TaxID=2873262 RepID=UPI001CED384C|nr:hypothetical protein [Streptomyces sp. HPF1205]